MVGYDDLVYTTATGNDIILQHGQSWTFECRYLLNSEGVLVSEVKGGPDIEPLQSATDEIQYDMKLYSDDTYNTVRFINFVY